MSFRLVSMGGALFVFLSSIAIRPLEASTVSADSIRVSTVTGQVSSNGIAISTNVSFASGGSLTLQGANGYLLTASSVTASAFFGDGGNLTGINTSILAATQTFSGGNTFTSSFTVQSNGRKIVLSTDPVVNNFSISPNGAVMFYPELHNSSSTTIPEQFTTNPTFGPCLNGSTLTITTAGGRVELIFVGVLFQQSISSAVALSFLQDGQFVNDLSATKGIVYTQRIMNTVQYSGSFHYLLDAPSPGSHSYCLTAAAPTGGTTEICNHAFNPGSTSENCAERNLFFIEEIR